MNGRATQDREEKSEVKAKQHQAKADAEGEREDRTTTCDADRKFLKDLTATCEQKKAQTMCLALKIGLLMQDLKAQIEQVGHTE